MSKFKSQIEDMGSGGGGGSSGLLKSLGAFIEALAKKVGPVEKSPVIDLTKQEKDVRPSDSPSPSPSPYDSVPAYKRVSPKPKIPETGYPKEGK